MKIRTFAYMGATLFALIGPAFAADPGWYAGIGAGLNIPISTKIDYETSGVSYGTENVGFDMTWRGITSLGYAWNNRFRLEGEFGYSDPNFDKTSRTLMQTTKADISQMTLMANALIDAPLTDTWYLTIGTGVGYVRTTYTAHWVTDQSFDANAFTWQMIAGATYKLNSSVDLQFDYRNVSINHLPYKIDSMDVNKILSASSHNFMVTLRWYFDQSESSAPASPPPSMTRSMPPVTAVPPPPPSSPPPSRTYTVFFDFNKTNLTPAALEVVADATKTAKTYGSTKVQIVGHTDTVGSEKYNQKLSEDRAEAVKGEMVREGINDSAIAAEGKGFHDLLVQTGPGVREPQNRRAVIDLSSQFAASPAAETTWAQISPLWSSMPGDLCQRISKAASEEAAGEGFDLVTQQRKAETIYRQCIAHASSTSR